MATGAWLSTLTVALALAGCFQPGESVDDGAARDGSAAPIELFTPDAAETPVCGPDPSPLATLAIRVRTSPVGGRFAPKNVGAIWIETAAGAFVKTVEQWGITRAKWLTRFQQASGGDLTDAITGATLLGHETHEPSWDLTDVSGCEIADGDYRVVFELTDKSGTGAALEVPFEKGQTPLVLTPADAETFHDLQLALD